MKEVFQGPRGRVLTVPDELREEWLKRSPKPSRSEREREVQRYWLERIAAESIQLHVLLTACVRRAQDENGGISFPMAELMALRDPKKMVTISSSNQIGEVRVTLPVEAEPTILAPGELAIRKFGGKA